MKKEIDSPILITGAERSGSTFVARILDMCGVWSGAVNNMFENTMIHSLHYEMLRNREELFPKTDKITIPYSWKELILMQIEQEGWDKERPWMVKGSILVQYWPVWHYAFPDAKWIIVRRRTGDVIQSCIKTGFMRTFKKDENLKKLDLETERDGWLWWVHQYENKFVEMIKEGLNCRIVWPDRLAEPVEAYKCMKQMYETVDWLGLKWDDEIPDVILPLFKRDRGIKDDSKNNN
jgi:hypothetical protein